MRAREELASAGVATLAGITIGPDNLQVTVSKEEVKTAPNIELRGDELSTTDESVSITTTSSTTRRRTPNAVADSRAADTSEPTAAPL